MAASLKIKNWTQSCKSWAGLIYTDPQDPLNTAKAIFCVFGCPIPSSIGPKSFDIRGFAAGWHYEGYIRIWCFDVNKNLVIAASAEDIRIVIDDYNDYEWDCVNKTLTLITPLPNIPAPYYPFNGTNVAGTSITFSWASVAAWYQLQVARAPTFTTGQMHFNLDNITTMARTVLALPDDGTVFYWRVRASNDRKNWTNWSTVFSFTNGIVAEEFSGVITRIELEHDGAQAPLPVAGIGQGETGLVHVWGRNNMTTTQRMGIEWEVKDPSGLVVQAYQEWEWLPYAGPGVEHHFVGPRLDTIHFDKVGSYSIDVGLYMNPDNPVKVDNYSGKLCTVEAVVPESQFARIVIFPPQPAQVTNESESVRFPIKFDHIGGDDVITLYAAVGDQNLYFDEVLHGEQRISVPGSDAWKSHYSYVDILMTPSISPGVYDAYAKIKEKNLVSLALLNCLTIKAVVEEFNGTITRVELTHNGTQEPPGAGIAQGEKGIVHVWGRNNMTTTQRMGIEWEVKNPSGIVVQAYQDWEELPYAGPGVEHHFVGPRLDTIHFDQVGSYSIDVGLYMNPDNPVKVDNYSGKLCTVEAVVEFNGAITKMELEYDEARASIPAHDIPQGDRGLVHVWGQNNTATAQQMGISWKVVDPDGVLVEEHEEWEFWPYAGPGVTKEFMGGRFDLSKQGTYRFQVDLLMNKPSPVIVDSYSGDLCTVTLEEVPPEYTLVQHSIYPWAYLFDGDAEVCTFEFKLMPEQVPGTEWLGERIVDAFATELGKEGSRLLELKVYRDITPMLWTNYRIKVMASASPLAWNLIIGLVLAILLLVAVIFVIKTIDQVFFDRKPLDEETKKTFSRETLVAMILDLEPATSPEILEGKSDQELRDLVNLLLAEKAPPVSWWPLAVVGGAAVLGAAAVFVLGRKKK